MKERRGWYLLIAALVIVLAVVLLAGAVRAQGTPESSSHAAVAPSPASLGGKLGSAFVVDGVALVIVNEPTWTGQYTPAANGTQVFAAALYLQCYDLLPVNVTLALGLWEQGSGFTNNQSVLLVPSQEVDVSLGLKPDPSWTNVRVYMDTSTYWAGQAATPALLLPVTFLDTGGLDLLGLAILYEGIAAFIIVLLGTRALMRRAKWAPRWSMGIVGHVILIGVLGAVVFDYPLINRTFAGWSPLLYVAGVVPLMFLWSLSLYNKAYRAMVLQWVFRAAGSGLALRRWLVRLAVLEDGRTAVIEETWKDTFLRMFRIYIVIDDPPLDAPEHFSAPVIRAASPTKSRKFGMRKRSPLDIPLLNAQEDDITTVYWAKTGEPLIYEPSRLTIHRSKHVAATALAPAHEKRVLCFPRVVHGTAHWSLHNIHYRLAAINQANGARVEDILRLYEEAEAELTVVKSHQEAEVERRVARRLAGLDSATSALTDPLNDEEARDEAAAKEEDEE